MTKWLLLCLGWAGLARGGVRIESTVTVREGEPIDTVLMLQGDSFRVDRRDLSTSALRTSTIFDGSRMLILNPENKTYTEMTLDQLEAKMAQLDEIKAHLPPAARAELEKQGAIPTFSFKRVAGSAKVAGIGCQNYQLLKDGHDQGINCLADWKGSSPVHKEDLAPMKKLIQAMQSISRLSPGDLEMGRFDEWPGWPLLMYGRDGHEISRVVKITRMDVPASELQPPADYTSTPFLGGSKP